MNQAEQRTSLPRSVGIHSLVVFFFFIIFFSFFSVLLSATQRKRGAVRHRRKIPE